MKKLIPEFYEKNEALSRVSGENAIPVQIDAENTVYLDYQGWPTICKGDGDTLYASASLRIAHVDPFAVTAFFVSKDGGKTWSKPKIINDTPTDDRDTGILYMGNGRLLVTFFTIPPKDFREGGSYQYAWGLCSEELKAAKLKSWETLTPEQEEEINGAFVLLSEDYGETWTKPIRVPLTAPHGPTLMQDGKTLLFLGKAAWQNRCKGFENIGFGYHAAYSHDWGRTWEYGGTVPLPEVSGGWGYWEPHGIQLKNGKFLGAIRTGCIDNSVIKDNSNRSLGVMITHSEDGKTWTMGEKIPNVCGAPPHLLELPSGAILLVYSHRMPHCGARGRISYDGGYTWSDDEIIISEASDPNNYDLGYPSTARLDDGTLITTYYQAYRGEKKPTTLYTRWRLIETDEEI